MLAVVSVVVLLALPGFDDGGPEMDEGVLVAYPSLISEQGLVPGRDFETFYGPGQPYLLAGLGELFGLSLELERITGLAFQLVIALAVFALVLPLGRWLAAAAALACAIVLAGLGLLGSAMLGGLACLLAGFAFLAHARREAGPARWPVLVAGVAAAGALTFRPDLAPAVLLSAAPLLLWPRRGRSIEGDAWPWLAALIAGLIPLVAWLAVVGPDGLARLVDDLVASREGRHLPLPDLTSTDAALLAAWVLVVLAAAVAAFLRLRQDRYDINGRVVVSIALLLLALLPSALQRADAAHILPGAAIAIGLSPIVGRVLLDLRPGRMLSLGMAATAAVIGIGFAHAAATIVRAQARSAGESGVEVEVGERSFRLSDPAAASDLRALLAEIQAGTNAGDSIFVGPADLSRTVYSDSFVYYLLPELVPASFYTELNPGTANAEDTELPDELDDADVLLLTDRWRADTAAAAEAGSTAAREIVDGRFCPLARSGSYEVLSRCDDRGVGDG